MLESLTIRNYAIIDEMTSVFFGGLNVITGETGAGKSIVVDALDLVLGARASGEMIRSGAGSLEVTGVFNGDTSLAGDVLPDDADDNILILRREVRVDGKNRCFINDRPVTLKTLKEIGKRLVDFHGQHDHQSLLDVSEHVLFLDGYGECETLADEVSRLYVEMLAVRESIQGLRDSIERARRDKELYEFQRDEIDTAAIAPHEDDETEAAIRKLSSAGDLKTLGLRIFQMFSEADGSVAQKIGEIASDVENMSHFDDELVKQVEILTGLIDGVEDSAKFFRDYSERIDDDPALLAEMDDRLALIERLKKKYGPRLDDVFAYREKIGRELTGAEQSEDELNNLIESLSKVEDKLAVKASQLTKKRRTAAPRLSKEVEAHLAELGMSGARIVVDISECESREKLEIDGKSIPVSANGCDRVEFLITANPGEPPRPLVKVASGGEISRVMLSLKLSLIDVNKVPSMVFDEIDVGVSGRIAEAIGRKLLKLTEKRQAIVITHLPQIAVMGKRHFSARKTVDGNRTQASLLMLDDEMRQRELASLLSGETLTESALAHAKELMDAQGDSEQ